MRSPEFQVMKLKEFNKKFPDGFDGMNYDEYVESERELFNDRVSKATAVLMKYTGLFLEAHNQNQDENSESPFAAREKITDLRNQMRDDPEFIENSVMIATFIEDEFNWVNGIIRSEARRVEGVAQEKLQKLKEEKELRLKEEKAKEVEELQCMSTFGMF